MKGPYTGMPEAHDQLHAFMAARGYERAGRLGRIRQRSGDDPGSRPLTNIYQPVK
jgi:hypothetical protein